MTLLPRPVLCPCQTLAETKKELLKAATAADEAAADAERLRRHVKSVEGEVRAVGRRTSLRRFKEQRCERFARLATTSSIHTLRTL